MQTLDNLHTIDIQLGEVGTTVRLGSKWAARLSVGEKFRLQESLFREHGADGSPILESTIVGAGQVTKMWQGKFEDIPFWVIEAEHDESSRSYEGLRESMERAYGEDKFNVASHVTALSYIRCEL